MKPTPPIQSQEQVTTQQFGALLSTLATLIPYFTHIERLPEGDGKALDGGAKAALETTLVNLCSRLDSMLTDERRWSLEPHKNLEAQLSEVYETHIAVLKEQKFQMERLNAPHTRHSPKLMKMVDGAWLALLGSLDNLDNAIVGIGPTPEAALLAFDCMFKGDNLPPHIVEWIKAREFALSKNLTPPEEPKNHEQQSEVDLGAGSTTPKDESPKTRPRRNRKGPRKNPNSGGSKSGPSPEGDSGSAN